MSACDWQPTASRQALEARARLLTQIRQFFADRGVLEVEVPLLAAATVTDPHIDSIQASCNGRPCYLQTSPEFAMKRLLASGSGPIYSLGKAFRNGESGRRHNPEFTMLEWYRPGFDDHRLMDEVEALIGSVLPLPEVQRLSYRELFLRYLDIDPHRVELGQLKGLARQQVEIDWEDDNRDTWLDMLITHAIEPQLGAGLTFIYDYPASQAALARVCEDDRGQPVARRFEAYVGGMELANGYWELTDSQEQARRFQADLTRRQALGLAVYPEDQRLLAALAAGLPDTAGVALGVDRLLMLATGADSLQEVLAFPFSRA